MPGEEVEKISGVEGVGGVKKVQEPSEVEGVERAAPNKEKFDGLVQKPDPQSLTAQQTQQVQGTEKGTKPSPMDAASNVRPVERVGAPVHGEIVRTTETLVRRIDEVRKTLETPGAKIKPGRASILRNHLSSMNRSIQEALTKVGVEGAPAPTSQKGAGAIERFLDMLAHGQSQLNQLSSTMGGETSSSFSPAQLLAVQLKVNHMQQEIEFFTSALSKALEGIKTLMNVQV